MTGIEPQPVASGPQDGTRQVWLLLAWVASLVAAVWLFAWLGRGALATPPITDPGALPDWSAGREPVEIVFAGLRLLVLALAWYLLGVTTIGAAARLTRAARLTAVADVLTVPAVRRLLQGALGVGLAATAVTSLPLTVPAPAPLVTAVADPVTGGSEERPAAADAYEAPGAPAVAPAGPRPGSPPPRVPADDPASTRSDVAPPDAADVADRPPHRVLAPDAPWGAPLRPTTAGVEAEPAREGLAGEVDEPEQAARPRQAPRSAGAADSGAGASDWRVASGEHLWSIAETALTSAWTRAPSEGDVRDYWVALIERNRSRLPDPSNPDLIHPGLELELPHVPAEQPG